MLGRIRSIFAHSWVARIGAALLAISFGAWGIQGALFGQGAGPGSNQVATVDGQPITIDSYANAYDRQLGQSAASIAQAQGGAPDPAALPADTRRAIADGVLRRLVTEAAIVARARSLGLGVPDPTLRDAVFAIPVFKGPDGQFDRQKFNQVLAANHLTERQVLDLMRDELLSRGLIEPVRAGAVAPDVVVRTLFAYGAETRSVSLVDVPLATMPAPPAPDDATLQRFYDNHPALFRVPEFRHIRAVVLSPETVGRDIDVPEASIRAAYDAERATVAKPELRSAAIVTATDPKVAAAIAAFWRGGAAWTQVQQMATQRNAIAVALPNAAEDEFPSPALGRAVFAAAPDAVVGPIADDAGSVVLEVTKVTPAAGTFADEHDRLRDRLAAAEAQRGLQDRVDRLSDAIAGGGLDRVPADLGAAAVSGSLDAAGMTADGGPAPIPGSDAFRQAVIAATFAGAKGAPPNLTPGPDHGYFALVVDGVTPAHERSFAEARADVLRLWTADATRREANEAATAIYTAAQRSHALTAAEAGGRAVETPAPFRRDAGTGGAPGVPRELATVAFGLRQGEATMVGTADGFTVAVLTAIGHPTAADAPEAYDRLRQEVVQSMSDDLEISYAGFLTAHARVRIDQAAVARVASP